MANQLSKLDDLFHELYEGTKKNFDEVNRNVKELDAEYKEHRLDDNYDLDSLAVDNYVREFLKNQCELMNVIYDKYNALIN